MGWLMEYAPILGFLAFVGLLAYKQRNVPRYRSEEHEWEKHVISTKQDKVAMGMVLSMVGGLILVSMLFSLL